MCNLHCSPLSVRQSKHGCLQTITSDGATITINNEKGFLTGQAPNKPRIPKANDCLLASEG